jgi:hypothetical protein
MLKNKKKKEERDKGEWWTDDIFDKMVRTFVNITM